MEKEMKRGTKILVTERTVFNDEEQRRYVLWLMSLFCSWIDEFVSIMNCYSCSPRFSRDSVFQYSTIAWLELTLCNQWSLFLQLYILRFQYKVVWELIVYYRQEMLRERERQKEVEIEALKHSMQSGMVSFSLLSWEYHPALSFQWCAVCWYSSIWMRRLKQWKSKLNSGKRWHTNTKLVTLRWR